MDYSIEDIYDSVKAIVNHFHDGFKVELTETYITIFDQQHNRVGFVVKTSDGKFIFNLYFMFSVESGIGKTQQALSCYTGLLNNGGSPNEYPFIIFLSNITRTYPKRDIEVDFHACTFEILVSGCRYEWEWDSAWRVRAAMGFDVPLFAINIPQECLKWNESTERKQMLEALTKESTDKEPQSDITTDVPTTTTVQSGLEATIITMLRKIPTAPYDEQKNCVAIVKELMTLIN